MTPEHAEALNGEVLNVPGVDLAEVASGVMEAPADPLDAAIARKLRCRLDPLFEQATEEVADAVCALFAEPDKTDTNRLFERLDTVYEGITIAAAEAVRQVLADAGARALIAETAAAQEVPHADPDSDPCVAEPTPTETVSEGRPSGRVPVPQRDGSRWSAALRGLRGLCGLWEAPGGAPGSPDALEAPEAPTAQEGPGDAQGSDPASTPQKGQSAIWSTSSAIPMGILAEIRDVLRAGPLSFLALRAKIGRGWRPAREALQALVDTGEVIREGSRGRSVRYRLVPRVDDSGQAVKETPEDAGHLVFPDLAAVLESPPARATERRTGILKGRIRKEIEALERQYAVSDNAGGRGALARAPESRS